MYKKRGDVLIRMVSSYRLFFMISMIVLAGCTSSEKDQGQEENLLRTAERMEATGNMGGAAHVYRKLLDGTSGDKLPLYLKLGASLIAAGDMDEARKVFEEALRVDTGDQAKGQLGRCYLMAGKADMAITIFQDILKTKTDNVQAYNCLGVAYDLKKDHKTAQDFYKKALELDSDNVEIKANLALSLAFSCNYAEALQLMVPIGSQLGATAKQRHNLATVYALAGQEDKATELFGRDFEQGRTQNSLEALRGAHRVVPESLPDKSDKEELDYLADTSPEGMEVILDDLAQESPPESSARSKKIKTPLSVKLAVQKEPQKSHKKRVTKISQKVSKRAKKPKPKRRPAIKPIKRGEKRKSTESPAMKVSQEQGLAGERVREGRASTI